MSYYKIRIRQSNSYTDYGDCRAFGVATAISLNEWRYRKMGWFNRRDDVNVDDFDPDGDYTSTELDAYADAFLRKNSKEKPINVYPQILMEEHLYNRRRREILTNQGFPDESLTEAISKDGQMLYQRQHPQGRRVNTDEARARGSSYYA